MRQPRSYRVYDSALGARAQTLTAAMSGEARGADAVGLQQSEDVCAQSREDRPDVKALYVIQRHWQLCAAHSDEKWNDAEKKITEVDPVLRPELEN